MLVFAFELGQGKPLAGDLEASWGFKVVSLSMPTLPSVATSGLVGTAMTRTVPPTQSTIYRLGFGMRAEDLTTGCVFVSAIKSTAGPFGFSSEAVALLTRFSGCILRSCRSSCKALRTLKFNSSSLYGQPPIPRPANRPLFVCMVGF